MPKVPEVELCDITISEEHTKGFGYDRCVAGLWCIYNVIKKIISGKSWDIGAYRNILECLYTIGVNGEFVDNDLLWLVYSGKTNKKYRRNMPAAKYLFALEEHGFVIHDLVTAKEGASKKDLAVRDIVRFSLSYAGGDFHDVIFGLKLFSDICMKQSGDCFYTGDIRVAFIGAPKLYAPPVNEVFYFLPDEQKKLAYAVHNKLQELGCVRNLEREYMTRYVHPKNKGHTFATIYAAEHLYFLPESEVQQKLAFKLNLRNISGYTDYLYECTKLIQKSVTGAEDCGICKKACGGVEFDFNGVHYRKCPWHIFRFNDLSEKAGADYIGLIELENEFLSGK